MIWGCDFYRSLSWTLDSGGEEVLNQSQLTQEEQRYYMELNIVLDSFGYSDPVLYDHSRNALSLDLGTTS